MNERRALCVLLTAAFFVRVLYFWVLGPYEPGGVVPNLDFYQSLAHGLRTSGSFLFEGSLTAAREPAYPIFLAALYSIAGGSFPVIWITHALLDAATVLLVFLLGARIFSRNVAWAAAAIAAFYPQLIYYVAEPRRESFLVCMLALSVWTTLWACDKRTLGRFALPGFLWAVCALTKSVYLPVAGLAAVIVWVMGRRRGRSLSKGAAVFLAVFLGVYALWPLRNYLVFGRFIPGVAGGGAHLYVGLIVPNEAAGTPEEEKYISADPDMRASHELSTVENDSHFYRAAGRWIRDNPRLFVWKMILSAMKMWRLYPYERDYGRNYRLIKWVGLLSDGWIIPLGLVGILLARRRYVEADLIGATVLATTFIYMIFWAVVRYRLPLMPYIFLYAAYALERAAVRVCPGRLPFPAAKESS